MQGPGLLGRMLDARVMTLPCKTIIFAKSKDLNPGDLIHNRIDKSRKIFNFASDDHDNNLIVVKHRLYFIVYC
jgi:hypothetical protein